jgi:predicted RNase H-like HicB family nuclease
MSNVIYTALFTQAEDGGWNGYVPDLPTILVGGYTQEEATKSMEKAISMWIEYAKETGLPIPAPTTRVVGIEVVS